MRANIFRLLCGLTLCLAGTLCARAQDEQTPTIGDDIQVRGAFLTTRPAPEEKKKPATPDTPPAKGRTTPERTQTANTSGRPQGAHSSGSKNSGSKNNGAKNNPTASNTTASNKNTGTAVKGTSGTADATPAYTLANFSPSAIGLGYTLYMKDANGDATRVDPSHVFHSGEAIRLSLEANTDGYLYVFYTENGSGAQMIFPDARLGRGNNYVRAHVPYEVPSNMEANESLRWFVFDTTPATERVYIVLTREPLPDVPTGEGLVSYCLDTNHSCPWNPSRTLWADLTKEKGQEQVATSKIKDEGRTQTPREREATTRGLGLAADAPEPTIVRMNASSTTGLLVTSVALTHK